MPGLDKSTLYSRYTFIWVCEALRVKHARAHTHTPKLIPQTVCYATLDFLVYSQKFPKFPTDLSPISHSQPHMFSKHLVRLR